MLRHACGFDLAGGADLRARTANSRLNSSKGCVHKLQCSFNGFWCMFRFFSQDQKMNNNDLTEEQKKLVWRYVTTWRRFRRLPDGYRSFAKLEDDLAQGSGMFLCGLLVEAHSGTVITADVKDPEFHAVIFGNDDNAVSDMTTEELQQARGYIIHGEGAVPIRGHHSHRMSGSVALCPLEPFG